MTLSIVWFLYRLKAEMIKMPKGAAIFSNFATQHMNFVDESLDRVIVRVSQEQR